MFENLLLISCSLFGIILSPIIAMPDLGRNWSLGCRASLDQMVYLFKGRRMLAQSLLYQYKGDSG